MASAIPIYNMHVLQLPKGTTGQIDKMYREFWWGEQEDKKTIHTINWSEICKTFCKGGLGIRDTDSNDMALLTKTCWRYLCNDNLLCSKIIKARYYLKNPCRRHNGSKKISGSGKVSWRPSDLLKLI